MSLSIGSRSRRSSESTRFFDLEMISKKLFWPVVLSDAAKLNPINFSVFCFELSSPLLAREFDRCWPKFIFCVFVFCGWIIVRFAADESSTFVLKSLTSLYIGERSFGIVRSFWCAPVSFYTFDGRKMPNGSVKPLQPDGNDSIRWARLNFPPHSSGRRDLFFSAFSSSSSQFSQWKLWRARETRTIFPLTAVDWILKSLAENWIIEFFRVLREFPSCSTASWAVTQVAMWTKMESS